MCFFQKKNKIKMSSFSHNLLSRVSFSTSIVRCIKKGKKISPKNFSDANLKASSQFILRQLKDPYVKRRRLENYRCRSVFKLIQIDDEHEILKPGYAVIDLGAAPGSWSQVASTRVEPNGLVIAIDLLRFPPLENVNILTGDFTEQHIQKQISDIVQKEAGSTKVDVVLCDAAPKASGVKSMDHGIIVNLVTSATKMAFAHLKHDGTFLFKMLAGDKSEMLRRKIEPFFTSVKNVKPKASRMDSTEFYILCRGFKFPSEDRTPG